MEHPIWAVLKQRRLTEAWLADKTGFRPHSVYAVRTGRRPATERFRRACALALRMRVEQLFLESEENDPIPV